MIYNADELSEAITAVMPAMETGGVEDDYKNIYFNRDYVMATNERMCIAFPFETDMKCGVPGKELKRLIPSSGEVDIKASRSNMSIKSGKHKASLVTVQGDSTMEFFDGLNIQDITWKKIPNGLIEGMKLCRTSASRELSEPYLTCVLVKGKEIIASDEVRISRFVMKTGIKGSWLIPARSVNELVKMKWDRYGVSSTWIYLRGEDGKVLCARRIEDEYPDTSEYFNFRSKDLVKLPKDNTKAAVDYVSTMADVGEDDYKQISITFSGKKVTCRGEGDLGYAEKYVNITKKTKINFVVKINPEFFKEVLDLSNEVKVGDDRILIESENFKHLVALYE